MSEPNNEKFDECKFCDDSVGFMCEYHAALAEIGRLKRNESKYREALKEILAWTTWGNRNEDIIRVAKAALSEAPGEPSESVYQQLWKELGEWFVDIAGEDWPTRKEIISKMVTMEFAKTSASDKLQMVDGQPVREVRFDMNEERCLYCAKTKAECTGEPWADLSSHNFTPSPRTPEKPFSESQRKRIATQKGEPMYPEKPEGPRSEEFPNEFGYRKYQEGRRAGRAERNAEVEALKAEVARFSRDANFWKWCNGCGSAKEDCEKWKDAGKVACCPECHHWPWNR